MDRETRQDMYSMAEWAATQDAWARLLEKRTRRRRWFRFLVNAHQVVYEPTVAVATPGAADPTSAPPLGVASGPAGSTVGPPTALPTSPVEGSHLPGRPHHN
jgi:hypothetical protein